MKALLNVPRRLQAKKSPKQVQSSKAGEGGRGNSCDGSYKSAIRKETANLVEAGVELGPTRCMRAPKSGGVESFGVTSRCRQ